MIKVQDIGSSNERKLISNGKDMKIMTYDDI